MAENENQNELNRLEKDGRIDRENFDKENNGTIQKVARGKKHVNTVEQFVDMDLVMSTAMENKVYLNMLEPCVSEGINLTDRIKQYFIDNKVKPSEIAIIFQEEINKIRLSINKEVKGLIFDDNGMIDINRSIQEAKQYGVDVAGCVGVLMEEEGKKFEVGVPSNVFNVTKILDEKDNIFYEELFKSTQIKLEELSKNHNIDVILGESKENEPQAYKDFRNRFNNIKEAISKKLAANRNGIQKAEDVLKAYYEYQELLALDVDALEGISKEQRDELIHVLEELKDIYRDRFNQELGRPDFGDLSEEAVLEGISALDSERINEIKDAVKRDISRERFDGKTGFSDIRISEYERSKASKIGRINLFKSLTRESELRLIGSFSDEFKKSRYYDYDVGKHDNEFFKKISENDDRILQEAEEVYNQDQFIDIYSEIISRHYMKERLDNFSYVSDSKDSLELSKELDDMCLVINAAWILDEYTPMGERVEADLEFKKLAMQKLKEVFPDTVFARGSEVDGLDESFDAAIVVARFKERYKGIDEVDSIQTIEDFIQFTSVKSNIFVKSKFYEAMTFDDSEEAKEMNELLNSPETLEEVRKKHEIHKRIIVKEKRLTKISNEIIELTNKINSNTITSEEEIALVEKCAIILQEYNADAKYGLNVLNKIARENLALYLPDLFKNNNIGRKVNYDNFDSVYKHFLHERGIDVEDGVNPLKQAIERYDKEIEDEILQDVVKRNAAQESRQIKNQNIEKLEELDKLDDQERVLKFLRFAKKTIKNEKDEDVSVSSDKIENIEKMVKANIKEILVRSGKSEAEEEKIYKSIDDLVFDEGMYYSMMREIRIGYASSFAKEFSIKYSGKEITDTEDAKKIISLYLGIKRDIKNALFNKRNFMSRQQLLINLMKKIDPQLVDDVRDVNDKVLLQKYNELFGEKFENIDEAYAAEEKKVLEGVIGELEEEVQRDNGKLNQQPILTSIRSDTLLINSNLQRARLKEEHVKVNNTLTLVKDVQSLLKQRTEKGLSKEEEIKLVKTLALMVGILKDKPRHMYEELTDAEEKFEDLRTEALAIAYDNISFYFPDVMNKSGNIKELAFEEVYRKYLEENGEELPDGISEGKSILEAIVEEFDHEMEHYQDQDLRINIEDATINLMSEIDSTLKGFEEEKNETIYLNVIHTLRNLLEKQGHKKFDTSLKRRFDSVMPGIFDLALQTEDKFLIDDQYIDSLLVVAGKREMEEINNKYFPKGEKGRKHTKVEDIPLGEQTKIVQIAIGTIVACEDFTDYQTATRTDTKKKAVNLLSRFFDDVLDENGNLNKEAVLEQYREKLMSEYSVKYESFEEVAKKAQKRLSIKVAGDIVRDDKINSQYVSVFKNNALRYEIHRNNEEARISNAEIEPIIRRDAETVIVGDVSEIGVQNQSVVDSAISADEIEDGIEEIYEEIEVDDAPKASQAESTIINGFELEEINVQSESELVLDNHPIKIEEKGFFKKAFGALGKFVKEKIIDIKNNLFGETDTSTGEGSATTSSGGTDKTSQSSVKNLTGYDPIKLKLSQSPAQEVDSSIESKSNAGRDTEDLGEIEDF